MAEDRADFERTVAAQHIAAARAKSFTGPAVVVLILYFFLWVPGFIANVLYYIDAQQTRKVAGTMPPGMVFLSVMLWLNVAFAILSLVGVCVVGALMLLGIPVLMIPFVE